MGSVGEELLHSYPPGGTHHLLLHFGKWRIVIFQCKGDILPDGKSDELSVRVLKHGARNSGEGEDRMFPEAFSTYYEVT